MAEIGLALISLNGFSGHNHCCALQTFHPLLHSVIVRQDFHLTSRLLIQLWFLSFAWVIRDLITPEPTLLLDVSDEVTIKSTKKVRQLLHANLPLWVGLARHFVFILCIRVWDWRAEYFVLPHVFASLCQSLHSSVFKTYQQFNWNAIT